MELTLKDLMTAGGVLLGFEVASFSWRIAQEARVGERDDFTWLPPADILNILAMLMTVLGVFILPSIGLVGIHTIQLLLGLVTILFVGHALALAGHYELYNPNTKRSFAYFPGQEKIAVGLVGVCCLLYLTVALYLR